MSGVEAEGIIADAQYMLHAVALNARAEVLKIKLGDDHDRDLRISQS